MPSPYDIAFFKIAIYNKVTDQATATRCLQIIDQQAQNGRTVRAPEAFLSIGQVDRSVVQKLVQLTQAALQSQGGGATATAAPPPPPNAPPPAPPPSPTAPPPAPRSSGRMARAPLNQSRQQSARSRAQSAGQSGRQSGAGEDLSNISFRDKIGAGPIGASYDGVHRASQKPYVLKVLSSKFNKYPPLLEHVTNDVKAVIKADLQHPNILRTRHIFEREGRNVVVFDKGEGQALNTVVSEYGALPPRRALKIVLQIAQALEVAHQAGICHGDLRPQKILAQLKTGQTALMDFGLFRASALVQGYARQGVPFGHPCYLAPEVIQQSEKEPNPQHDVYALGIMLYELVCGRRPFVGKEVREILAAHLKHPIPKPPADVYLHRKLAQAVLHMTAKTPAKRLKNGGEVVRLLTSLTQLDLEASEEVSREQNQMSGDDWTEHSGEAAKGGQDWSEEKIAKAQPGVELEWNPDDEEDDPEWEDLVRSKRMQKQKDDTHNKKKHNPDLQAFANTINEAAAVQDKKTSKKASAKAAVKKGGAGNRFQLQGDEIRRRQERAQQLGGFVLAGSVALFMIVGVVIGYNRTSKPPKTNTVAKDEDQDPEDKPKIGKPEAIKDPTKTADFRRESQKMLSSVRSKTRTKLDEGRYPEALLELQNAPLKYRKLRRVREELKTLQDEVLSKAKSSLNTLEKNVKSMLAKGQNRKALNELSRYEKRLIRATQFKHGELKKQVKAAIEEEKAKLQAELALRAKLKKLKPWQRDFMPLLFGKKEKIKEEQLVISYDFTKLEQLLDFDLGSSKQVAAGTEKRPGVDINPGDGFVDFVFPIAVTGFTELEVKFELINGGNLKTGSDLAMLVKVDPFQRHKGEVLRITGRRDRFFKKLVGEEGGNKTYKTEFKTLIEPKAVINPWEKGVHSLRIKARGASRRVYFDKKRILSFTDPDIEGLVGFRVKRVTMRVVSVRFKISLNKEATAQWVKDKLSGKKRRKK